MARCRERDQGCGLRIKRLKIKWLRVKYFGKQWKANECRAILMIGKLADGQSECILRLSRVPGTHRANRTVLEGSKKSTEK